MDDDDSLVHQLENQIQKLGSIEQMPELMEKSRIFLTHFIKLYKTVPENVINDYYFQTLYLCETAIWKCDVTERNKTVLDNILKTILETIHSGYLSTKMVIESLDTLYRIMCNLYHLEVVQAHPMLCKKLPFLNRFFCEMEHYGIMFSIVGILYQYVCKYDDEERPKVFAEIMHDFNDPTKQLADMLQWAPETFNTQCRKYLNNIPDRKYYSLAARSAVLGGKTFIPLNDMPFISLEWNIHPSELSFKALFSEEMDNSFQASIDFKDVRSLEIIEDLEQPRVVCTYEKITIVGIAIEQYDLRINVVDINELSELAEFVTPLLNSVTFVRKNVSPVPEPICDETVIRHEKFYNTLDLASGTSLEEDNDPIPKSAVPKHNSQIVSAAKLKHDSPPKMLEVRENGHNKENRDESSHLSDSSTTNFQPFDTKWKQKLLQHTNKKTELPLTYDPYDIKQMRDEKMDQPQDTFSKRCKNGRKNGRTENVDKRPIYMQCSTPTKSRRTTFAKSLINEELSSICDASSDESIDNEKNDATYVPYSMLSTVGMRGRASKKGSKRQSIPSTCAQPTKKSNTKMIRTKPPLLGTGTNRKTQIGDISSSTPHVETAMQAVVPRNDVPTCATIAPYTMLSQVQPHGGNRKSGELPSPPTASCGMRKRLNSKHTTTTQTTTTKTTTTKTTAVGLATCPVTGPAEDTTMQEHTLTMPPSEILPCHATEKLECRALYTVEKHQEYRVHHTVNEAESFVHALSEGDRRQALAYARKIVDILTHGM